MSEDSDVEKTEEPTPHRVQKAREKGQIPRSRELTAFLVLLTGWGGLWLTGEYLASHLAVTLRHDLMFDHSVTHNSRLMLQQVYHLLKDAIIVLLPIVLALISMAIIAPNLLGGILLSGHFFKFDLQRINPLAGFKRLFSPRIFVEMFKTGLKVGLVAWGAIVFMSYHWQAFIEVVPEYPIDALRDAMALIAKGTLVIILSLLAVVGYDIFYQLSQHVKKLRMTRQEIRDEFKQHEGDPQVKGRIRQLQRRMAQQRMMADVPKADVIVNNPTHYAVALKYEEGVKSAPIVLAKGMGEIALKIRTVAQQHKIPMLSAPQLSRSLYRYGVLGKPIPVALYQAVAEVLAWVYNVRRWRKEGGLFPRQPHHVLVPKEMRVSAKEADV